jgi:tetratricopeptide (TPR) repeat protein
MARTYARVAPAAQHALHMPSHVFVALGMWDDSVRSNVDSAAAADARRARKGLSVDARGYHSLQWLAYSYLQLGRVGEARALLDDMARDARESGSVRARSTLAAMRATHLVATDQWRGEVAALAVDADGAKPATFAADRFVAGRIALAAGDPETAAAADAAIAERRRAELAPAERGVAETADADCCEPAYAAALAPADRPDLLAALVMETQLDGLALLAAGRADAGLERLRQAAATEDRMPFDFGPPDVVAPAHELLGEALLDADRFSDAAREFQAALDRAPRRARSLLGLARAYAAAGEAAAARAAYGELLGVWHAADQDHAALAEARRGAEEAAPRGAGAGGAR